MCESESVFSKQTRYTVTGVRPYFYHASNAHQQYASITCSAELSRKAMVSPNLDDFLEMSRRFIVHVCSGKTKERKRAKFPRLHIPYILPYLIPRYCFPGGTSVRTASKIPPFLGKATLLISQGAFHR